MRVEVDTKHDHPDHIRQAVQLLQSILDGPQSSSVSSPGEPLQTYSPSQPAQETSTDTSGGIFDIFNDTPPSREEKSDDTVRIIQY